MITVEGVQHVSLAVTDLDRARRFYTEVLGLAEIARPDFDCAGAWYGIGSQQIHLIVHPVALTLRGTDEISSRDGHVALRVAGYDETLAHLGALGVPVIERPHNKTPWAQIYVADPDGNVIELNAERVE
jgi:catechol 2,3-dioxygenase-like lactoylglutathione lyase family enzyme